MPSVEKTARISPMYLSSTILVVGEGVWAAFGCGGSGGGKVVGRRLGETSGMVFCSAVGGVIVFVPCSYAAVFLGRNSFRDRSYS